MRAPSSLKRDEGECRFQGKLSLESQVAGEAVYRKPGNIVFREEEDGAILFNADDGSVFLLEELGWALYHHLLDKGATRSEMLASLKEHYPDEDLETLEGDLDAYLGDLEKACCIDKVEG